MLTTDMTETEVVRAVRDTVKAHVPEMNVWAEPNLPSIFTTVLGGIAFSALQEAKNGIDFRVMPDTVTGSYLDALAVRPPYNTSRLAATAAKGSISVSFPGVAQILTGETFTRDDGTVYTACCDVTLDANGEGQVEIEAVVAGTEGNSVFGYPFTDTRGDASVSATGIGGGNAVECDEDLRQRLYAFQPNCAFGSLSSIEGTALGVTGVSHAVACPEVGGVGVYVAITDQPVLAQADLDPVQAVFDDPCNKSVGICVTVKAVSRIPLDVVLSDLCTGVLLSDVEAFLSDWVDGVAQPKLTITAFEVETALGLQWPNVPWQVLNGPFVSASNTMFTGGAVTT